MSRAREALLARLRADGPMSVAEFMRFRLADPETGYYLTEEPFGAGGDFVTAPEISQMFGEMLGLWLAQVWLDQGAPDPFLLVEMGPGRGTLMADALRAAGRVPGFLKAARLWLIEISPRLRGIQAGKLAAFAPGFAADLAELPAEGPLLLLANELFDALPIRQFQRAGGVWRERLIGLAPEGDAPRFGLGPPVEAAGAPEEAPEGALFEVSPESLRLAARIGGRLARSGGAALWIDYGHAGPALGDTLQALRRHAFADVLDLEGPADLTAHVDFSALGAASAGGGARVWPLRTQGGLLESLGIGARAPALARSNPARAEQIAADRLRLTAPDQMGRLFKALALTGPGAPPPPGFG
ncbi:SAM-dependent methyltransferase [Neomegalonema sp.]|uniref:class I SAM-dependent methyltransferase n=1 Tax=Neomegalonema sp. TaxID=2039713 RepID=UPI002638DE78|nr:SAM-dependent methyltransferase [Neomegalonema sp.]MDD2869466.1 SAM-dependent methyltransferase [Neomegalonema sp.]